MGWPQRALGEDEQVVLDLRRHGKALVLPSLALVGLLAAGGFLLAVAATSAVRWGVVAADLLLVGLLCAVPVLRWRARRLVVTTRRVLVREGVLRRTGREVELEGVADLASRSTLAERVLRSGTVVLEPVAGDEPLVLPDVPEVERVVRTLYELLEREHRRAAAESA